MDFENTGNACILTDTNQDEMDWRLWCIPFQGGNGNKFVIVVDHDSYAYAFEYAMKFAKASGLKMLSDPTKFEHLSYRVSA